MMPASCQEALSACIGYSPHRQRAACRAALYLVRVSIARPASGHGARCEGHCQHWLKATTSRLAKRRDRDLLQRGCSGGKTPVRSTCRHPDTHPSSDRQHRKMVEKDGGNSHCQDRGNYGGSARIWQATKAIARLVGTPTGNAQTP